MLVEIHHKITKEEIPHLIAELAKIPADNQQLKWFIEDAIGDLKSYLED
jgi:hypothetical protein